MTVSVFLLSRITANTFTLEECDYAALTSADNVRLTIVDTPLMLTINTF